MIKREAMEKPGTMAHICNPECVGDTDRRITVWGELEQKKLTRRCLKEQAEYGASYLYS
jgi:hypothetical protein